MCCSNTSSSSAKKDQTEWKQNKRKEKNSFLFHFIDKGSNVERFHNFKRHIKPCRIVSYNHMINFMLNIELTQLICYTFHSYWTSAITYLIYDRQVYKKKSFDWKLFDFVMFCKMRIIFFLFNFHRNSSEIHSTERNRSAKWDFATSQWLLWEAGYRLFNGYIYWTTEMEFLSCILFFVYRLLDGRWVNHHFHSQWAHYHPGKFNFQGYGNITPSNSLGRIFMIFYALIGIPVNGFLFAYLGDFFGKVVCFLWHWMTY